MPQPARITYETFHALHNTEFRCADRRYTSFGLHLKEIRLSRTLEDICADTKLYLRSSPLYGLVSALVSLKELKIVDTIGNAVRNNLLPSATELMALDDQMGGAPAELVSDDQTRRQSSTASGDKMPDLVAQSSAEDLSVVPTRGRRKSSIDTRNPAYDKARKVKLPPINAIAANKAKVAERSRRNSETRPKRLYLSHSSDEAVFNYSSQTRNSTERVKGQLQERLKGSKVLHTYSPGFQSGTFTLQDPEAIAKVRITSNSCG